MRKIFYTVEPQVTGDGQDGFYATGNKEVSVYEIHENVPTLLTTLDLEMEDSPEVAINNYLEDVGIGAELVRL